MTRIVKAIQKMAGLPMIKNPISKRELEVNKIKQRTITYLGRSGQMCLVLRYRVQLMTTCTQDRVSKKTPSGRPQL